MQDSASPYRRISRRCLIGCSMAGIAAVATGRIAKATAQPRKLSFYNLHTFEELTSVYWHDGSYDARGLAEISFHLRDFRSGGMRAIDPYLLDSLYDVVTAADYDRPIHVISGYRTPATNAMLAAKSDKVSRNSYHIRGKAIDIRLPGLMTTSVRDVAKALAAGGVGYYPESDFVHLDTGPVRAW